MPRGKIVANLAVGLNADTRGLSSAIKRVRPDVRGLNKEFGLTNRQGKKAASGLDRLTTGLTRFGLASQGLGIGTNFLGAPLRGFLEFDREITKVQTLVGIAKEDVDRFRVSLSELSTTSGRPLTELAQGFFDIQSAGLRGRQALEAIEAASKAAAAGLGSVKDVSEAVTTALGAYSDGSVSAIQATDVLLATVREGRAAPQELVRGFARLLALSSQAGVEFYDAAAAIATLTKTGFDAQNSFTGLRQAMVVINRPTLQTRKVIEDLGLSIEEFQGLFSERGIIGGLRELQRLLGQAGIDIGDVFVEASSGAVIRQILANLETADATMQSVRDSAGATQRAWEQWAASTEGRLTLATNAFRNQLIEIASIILPPIVENLDRVIGVIGAIIVRVALLSRVTALWGKAVRVGLTGLRAVLTVTYSLIKQFAVFLAVMEAVAALFEVWYIARQEGVGLLDILGGLLRSLLAGTEDVTKIEDEIAERQRELIRNEQLLAELRERPSTGYSIPGIEEAIRQQREQIGLLKERANILKAEQGLLSPQEQIDAFGGPFEPDAVRAAVIRAREALAGRLQDFGAIFGIGDDTLDDGGKAATRLEQELERFRAEAEAEAQRILGAPLKTQIEITPEALKFSDATLRGLRDQAEAAENQLRLVGLTNAERAKGLAYFQVEQKTRREIARIDAQLADARAKFQVAEENGEKIQAEQFRRRIKGLSTERAIASALITAGTESNAAVMTYVGLRAKAVEQARIEEGLIENLREHHEEILSTVGQAGRDAEDLVRGERQQLAIARVRASYQDGDSVAAQLAVRRRELEFDSATRLLNLERQREAALRRHARAASERDAVAANAAILELKRLRDRIGAEHAYREAIDDVIEAMRQRLEIEQETAEELGTTWEEFFQGYKASAEDALLSVLEGTTTLKDAVKQLIAEMLREFLRLAVVRPLINSIFGAFSGGLFGGVIPTFHDGGYARRGFAVVGEGGPELIDFRRPGRVYSNEQLSSALSGAGGGLVLNLTQNIESTDGPGVRAALAEARPLFVHDARAFLSRQMGSDTRFRQSVRRA